MRELMNLPAHGKPGSRRLNLTVRPPLLLLLPASTMACTFKAHSAFSSCKPFESPGLFMKKPQVPEYSLAPPTLLDKFPVHSFREINFTVDQKAFSESG